MSVTGLTTAGAAPGSSSRTTAMAGQATRRTLRDRLLGFTDPHRGRIASERPPSGYGSLAAEPKTFSSGRRTTGVRRAATGVAGRPRAASGILADPAKTADEVRRLLLERGDPGGQVGQELLVGGDVGDADR